MSRVRSVLSLVLMLPALLTLPAESAGQTPPADWTLSGQVRDSGGLAVPGATVVVANASSGFERVVTTDANGQFTLTALTGQSYRVTATLKGFDAAAVTATRDAAKVELVLRPATHVEQVTVSSSSRIEERRDTLNTRVDVVGSSRLVPTARASVGEVLREVPGVVTRRGSEGTTAAGEQVQGLDSRQVAVLLDGQPIVGARGIKSGIVNLDRQAVDQLERVEVVKGASSALFGSDAIGGAINLITRQPAGRVEVTGAAAGGTVGARDYNTSAGAVLGRVSFVGTAGRHERDSFDLSPATSDTTGSTIERNSFFGKAGGRLAQGLNISGTATGYWNEQTGRFIGETGLQDSDVDDKAWSGHVSLDWQPAGRTTVQFRTYASRYREDSLGQPIDPTRPMEVGLVRESLLKTDATVGHVLGEHQYLQTGVEWWGDRYDGINRLRDSAGHEATTSVFWFQDRVSLFDRATVTVGARYDSHSVFGSELSPKVGLNVRAMDGLHLRASYGEGFRAPDLGQLYYRFVPSANVYQVIGNPSLRPETSDSWQVGGDYSFAKKRVRVGINGFRNNAIDLITSESLGFLTSPAQLQALVAAGRVDPSFSPVFGRLLLVYRNLSNVRTQGAEADAEVAIGRGFTVAGSYTYLDAIDRATGLELTGRHEHQGFARATWTPASSPLRAEVRGAFYGSWLATATTRADAFALWDTIVGWRVRPGTELFAAVDNLFNSQDPNTGTSNAIYRPEIGRTWRAGLRWTWRDQ